MNNRILLINLNTCSLGLVYPIGLDYLSSVLVDQGYEIDALDLAVSDKSGLKLVEEKLGKQNYLAIGIGIRNLYDENINGNNYVPGCIYIIKKIKHFLSLRNRKEKIILGGAGFSLIPKLFINETNSDYGITGAGEKAFLQLLKGLQENDVPYHKIISAPYDFASSVYKRGCWGNFHNYFRNKVYGNLQTKRGCPMNCLYCEYPIIEGRTFQFRNPKIVAQEFLQLESLGFPGIYFTDATFNNPISQAKEILKTLKAYKSKKPWTAFFNPLMIDRQLLKLIKETNGEMPLKLTIESGSAKILKNLKKGYTVEDIVRTSKLCRASNVDYSFTLLFGAPGENKQTVKETCTLIKKLKPKSVTISIGVFIHPQTPIGNITFGKLWKTEHDFINPIIYPCRKDSIIRWINEELQNSGLIYKIYSGKESLLKQTKSSLLK